jgi:EmrB/QacA subfamily drug resistance transporter
MDSTAPLPAVGARAQARHGTVLAVASGAAFLAMLDATVANLAVADLHRDFPDAAVADLSWVITIYAIAFAALLAPGGRIADLVGRRALLTAGAALFTIMSIAAAAAPTLGVLLVARGLQGAGAAAMIPASLGVILADTPPERRAAAIGVWSAASALAAAAGPALGGVLVDLAGWRSVFFLTVPAGLAVLAGTQVLPMQGVRVGPRPQAPDALGIALLGAGVGALALGVSRASVWGWGDARTLSTIAGGVLGVVAVLVRSRRHPAPAVEVGLWRSRTFALTNLASLIYGAALFAWLLCGVLFLTQVWAYSPLQAGLAVSPGAIIAAGVALRAGPVVARYGPRPVVLTGLVVTAGTAFWVLSTIQDDPAFLTLWLPISFPLGLGMGAVATGMSAAAALAVGPTQFAAGVGLNQAARAVGGALGVAGMATILAGTDPSAADSYRGVFVMCTILLVAALGAAAGLERKGAER